MAVAAYASVLCLLRIVENIQHPSRLRLFPDPTQIDALREKLSFLQDFLELHSKTITEDIECMVRRIPRIAIDAETSIDKYVVDQLYRELHPQSDGVGCNIDSIHDEIHRVTQEIESINEALPTLRTTRHDDQEKAAEAQLDKFTGNKPLENKMVGFEDQSKQVLEKLTRNQPNLVIVPIVGMGGIGKTTLARSLFDHPFNRDRYHVRIWLTISQDYSVKKVLQGLLKDGVLGDVKDRELGDESEAELITKLHKKLFRQRYLIVLDDVWSPEAWDDLKRGFPNDRNGSRVMVTTRLSYIASSLGSENNVNTYSMKFLDEDNSWDLFGEKAFERGGRSRELEGIGREISRRCNGLPLMLASIGGLLANSDMTVEYWQTVKQNMYSFASSANDEYCSRILSLSYNHLPIHLKPCFLYMRHFEEDSDVRVSELIKRWVSEGFVKPTRGKSLEEAALIYLEDLIGRNMFLIRSRGRKGNIKVCGMHDLLRDLSIKESNKEQLLELPKTISLSFLENSVKCVLCNERLTSGVMTTLNSEILGSDSRYYGKMRLCSSCESSFPEFARSSSSRRFVMAVKYRSQDVPLPTTCRSFQLSNVGVGISLFHTLCLIWNMEILEFKTHGGDVLPKELWEMPQLRHVKVRRFRLTDPPSTSKNDVMIMEKLQTFKIIKEFKFTREIVGRIPNLRTLGVCYDLSDRDREEEEDGSCFYFHNLANLQKLQSLSIDCMSFRRLDLMGIIAFPCSLKEVTLKGCKIGANDLTIIGSLPNLQFLKLVGDSILGVEWNPIEGGFVELKYLELVRLDLVHWGVDETHFPALENIVLISMKHLEAIPREIGELPSLNSIYLQWCPRNVVKSAKDIVEEQLSCGNERLVVRVKDSTNRTYQIRGTNV